MKKLNETEVLTQLDYKNPEYLVQFLTPRKKIINREKTGLSAKVQHKLTKQIKYARYLALLPYVSYQNAR